MRFQTVTTSQLVHLFLLVFLAHQSSCSCDINANARYYLYFLICCSSCSMCQWICIVSVMVLLNDEVDDWCFKRPFDFWLDICVFTLLTKYMNPVILHCLKHWIFVAFNTDYAYTPRFRFQIYYSGNDIEKIDPSWLGAKYCVQIFICKIYGSCLTL